MVVTNSPSAREQEKGVDFLLAEYGLLKDLRASLITQNENRLNYYITVVSGVAAVTALIFKVYDTTEAFYFAALPVSFLLLLLGATIFGRLIETHISITIYARGLNRIRRYFLDNDHRIANYLMLHVFDDRPRFGALGFLSTKTTRLGLSVVPFLINSTLIGILTGFSTSLLFQFQIPASFVIGLITFSLTLVAHYGYYNHQIKKARKVFSKDFGIKFPSKQ